jgi:hypothetical protein
MRIPLLSRSSTLGAIVALLLSWVGPTAAHAQFRLSYPFTTSDPLPAGVFLFNGGANGTPGLRNGALVLTEDGQWQEGTIILETLPKQQRITSLRAEFDVRISGSDPIADGFSFNFGPAISHAAVGEDGVTHGFVVTFDSYDNGGVDSAPAVEVVYDGQVLSGVTFNGRESGRTNVWPGVNQTFNTGQNFVHVVVEVVPGDTGTVANVWWAGVQILKSVPLPETYSDPMDWSVAIGARTGSFHSLQYFKNL